MKVKIDEDEYWPYYKPTNNNFGIEVEVSRETYLRWMEVLKEHEQVQKEIAETLKNQEK